MKTTGRFDTCQYEIPCKYGEPFRIVPVGDIHRNAPMCAVEKWMSFCESERQQKIPTYYILMGDYDDMASTSERPHLIHKDLHDSTLNRLEESYRKYTRALANEMNFMVGKVICVLNGNHYGEFQNGTNTDQLLAEYLQACYIGVSAFIRLILRQDKHHAIQYDIFAHHGKGGPTKGSSINNVNKLILSHQADAYLMGHNHDIVAGKVDRLYLSNNRIGKPHIKNRQIALVRTGTFLKQWEEGKVSYGVDMCCAPSTIGTACLTLKTYYKKRRVNGTPEDRGVEVSVSI